MPRSRSPPLPFPPPPPPLPSHGKARARSFRQHTASCCFHDGAKKQRKSRLSRTTRRTENSGTTLADDRRETTEPARAFSHVSQAGHRIDSTLPSLRALHPTRGRHQPPGNPVFFLSHDFCQPPSPPPNRASNNNKQISGIIDVIDVLPTRCFRLTPGLVVSSLRAI